MGGGVAPDDDPNQMEHRRAMMGRIRRGESGSIERTKSDCENFLRRESFLNLRMCLGYTIVCPTVALSKVHCSSTIVVHLKEESCVFRSKP